MRRYTYQRISMFIMMGIFAFFIVQNPYSDQYVGNLKQEAIEASSAKDSLLSEIEQKASEYDIQPSNAKIDKVWKKMPGYNGLKINVQASYEKMKEKGTFDEDLLVFEQTSPKIHLKDLPPSPIYRGHPDKPMVAFTINVAWGNEYLSDMLAVLKKHHVYATFFIEGRWAKQNPDLVNMINEAGHEIGNHSYSHPNMKNLSASEIRKELQDTNEILRATTGKTPTYFAPPSGSFNEDTVQIAHQLNMETIMWTVDTIDWQKPAPSVIINRVMKQIHNGAIILMHPTASTKDALENLIINITQKGYKIGTVSELLNEKRIN